MKMNELKRTNRYVLVDIKENKANGRYQILEVTEDHPKGQTCGVYFNKRDAIKDFNLMNQTQHNMTGFIDYVLSFYGPGEIYDMGATRSEVEHALKIRLKREDVPFSFDSYDRELVRDIIIKVRAQAWKDTNTSV